MTNQGVPPTHANQDPSIAGMTHLHGITRQRMNGGHPMRNALTGGVGVDVGKRPNRQIEHGALGHWGALGNGYRAS